MAQGDWYYVDAMGARVGPIDAEVVADAIRRGLVGAGTLAWREGRADWAPLSGLEEFASMLPPSPPPHGGASMPSMAAEVVPAGFVRRWAALFLDSLILFVPLCVIAFVFGLASAFGGGGEPGAGFTVLVYLVYFVMAAFYYAGFESSKQQSTLGKRALGIKVTDLGGARISFAHALGRWFAAALSYLTLYVGFLIAAFTRDKRALHDYVAGTQVVDQWAYTDFPERQKRGLSGCLVVFLVAVLMVPVLAIFAAIGISQYQDYVIRAQVSEGSSLADGIKQAMAEAYSNHERMPANNAEAGLPEPREIQGAYVASVDIGGSPGRIDVVFSSSAPQKANTAIDGKHLYFDAQVGKGSIIWQCRSPDLKQKFCPSRCDCDG